MEKSRLQTRYETEIKKSILTKFNLKTVMLVPKIEKVVINVGVGNAASDQKFLDVAVKEIEAITGQKVLVTKAKKAIANFKLREEQGIGIKVTLRGTKMYHFLDKLFNVAMPRIRDFKGVKSTSFDSQGNFTLGIKEQIIFPEIDFDKVIQVRGMEISIVSSSTKKELVKELLEQLGMPFMKARGN